MAKIIVKDPKKIGEGRDSYIAYTVEYHNHHVQRRYSEFESFRVCLLKALPTVILPPLPEKLPVTMLALSVNKNAEASEVIEKRRKQLESFLNHLVVHPTVSKHRLFSHFLKDETWGQIDLTETEPIPYTGIFTNFTLYDRAVEKPDPKFAELWSQTHSFGQCAGAIERAGHRLSRRQTELATDFAELASCFNHFSLSERELGPGMEKLGMTFDSSFLALRAMTGKVEEAFWDPLGLHVLYIDSVKGVLQRRDQLQVVVESQMEVVSQKRNELKDLEAEAAGAPPANTGFFKSVTSSISKLLDSNPEQTRKDNIAKLQAEITQGDQEIEKANAALVKASETVLQEYHNYERMRRREMKQLLLAYAQAQIEFHHKQVQAWGVVVPLFDGKSS